jgi:hypothetical protein
LNLKAVGGLMRTNNPKRSISKFMVLKLYYISEYFGYTTNTEMKRGNAELHHFGLSFKGRYVKT